MNERKTLVEGLTSSCERSAEEEFVYAGKPKAPQAASVGAPPQSREAVPELKSQTTNAVVRVPLTTRIRSDFALALKRASLQRQLNGVCPNTLQDILEEALEPWLRLNGFLN
jgi:hypothetical protein